MRILVVSATPLEVEPLVGRLRRVSDTGLHSVSYRFGEHDVDVLTTGVGMVATAAWCSRAFAAEHYDLALNFGLCGSFDASMSAPAVVNVTADRIAELGAEDGDDFLTIQQLQLMGENEFPFEGGMLVNSTPPLLPPLAALRQVSGITVNTVHGNERTIAAVRARYAPHVESMEGAAFMYASLIAGVPFAQVRAISNAVERRNRGAWKIDAAIRALGEQSVRLLGVCMKLSLAFSPCPNDCFMFDAMVHGRIDLEGLEFSVTLADIEALNHAAFVGEPDVTKLSFHAYAYCADAYVLLDAGSALGRNCGPLLISRRPIDHAEVERGELSIAIPGKYTTANFLCGLVFPAAQNKTEVLFSEIEPALLDGRFDAGVIIHENRFTYAAKGLRKIIDLGEFWETETGAPIPLGGIVVKRSLPDAVKRAVNRVMRRSVEYAFAHRDASLPYVRAHAQEMSESVMYQHIDLYVNDYSIDLGVEGRRAVQVLFDRAWATGFIPTVGGELFLEQKTAP